MRNTLSLIAVAVALGVAAPVPAQQPKAGGTVTVKTEPGKGTIAEKVKITATIEAIDKASRAVTLKGPKGNSETVVAGPEVRNFDKLKVGDKVVVDYVQALSLELKKATGTPASVAGQAGAVRAKPGEKPGAAVGRQVTILADVVDLDAARQVVMLKGPKGNVVELKVRDPEQFKLVQKGDQVEATYTEALAVSVQAAK